VATTPKLWWTSLNICSTSNILFELKPNDLSNGS